MQFGEFVGQVHHRLELPGEGEALRVTRGVLTTRGERIDAGEATDLAAPPPTEVDRFLEPVEAGQQFGHDEFRRPGGRADGGRPGRGGLPRPGGRRPARRRRPGRGTAEVRARLPEEYDPLFEPVG